MAPLLGVLKYAIAYVHVCVCVCVCVCFNMQCPHTLVLCVSHGGIIMNHALNCGLAQTWLPFS